MHFREQLASMRSPIREILSGGPKREGVTVRILPAGKATGLCGVLGGNRGESRRRGYGATYLDP